MKYLKFEEFEESRFVFINSLIHRISIFLSSFLAQLLPGIMEKLLVFSRQAYLQSTSLFTISRCLDLSFPFGGALPWHAYHEWIFILLLPPSWQPLGIRVYLHGIPPRTSHRYFSSFPLLLLNFFLPSYSDWNSS